MDTGIKYKVWDGKTMWERGSLQVDLMPFGLSKCTFFEFEGIESGEIVTGNSTRDFTLLLCTGLQAKGDKYIYNGDILEHPTDAKICVEWDAKYGCWVAKSMDDESTTSLLANVLNDGFGNYEIVGNIHNTLQP
jgi:hypothetical protein